MTPWLAIWLKMTLFTKMAFEHYRVKYDPLPVYSSLTNDPHVGMCQGTPFWSKSAILGSKMTLFDQNGSKWVILGFLAQKWYTTHEGSFVSLDSLGRWSYLTPECPFWPLGVILALVVLKKRQQSHRPVPVRRPQKIFKMTKKNLDFVISP